MRRDMIRKGERRTSGFYPEKFLEEDLFGRGQIFLYIADWRRA